MNVAGLILHICELNGIGDRKSLVYLNSCVVLFGNAVEDYNIIEYYVTVKFNSCVSCHHKHTVLSCVTAGFVHIQQVAVFIS